MFLFHNTAIPPYPLVNVPEIKWYCCLSSLPIVSLLVLMFLQLIEQIPTVFFMFLYYWWLLFQCGLLGTKKGTLLITHFTFIALYICCCLFCWLFAFCISNPPFCGYYFNITLIGNREKNRFSKCIYWYIILCVILFVSYLSGWKMKTHVHIYILKFLILKQFTW